MKMERRARHQHSNSLMELILADCQGRVNHEEDGDWGKELDLCLREDMTPIQGSHSQPVKWEGSWPVLGRCTKSVGREAQLHVTADLVEWWWPQWEHLMSLVWEMCRLHISCTLLCLEGVGIELQWDTSFLTPTGVAAEFRSQYLSDILRIVSMSRIRSSSFSL